ncbi:MAG TPA: phosphoribosylanthranilate isomerase [Steroidobacteraceae bacterium]|nr:phosphoribosylanthranilate isomerase [Steroidobacteraceae bacterium]
MSQLWIKICGMMTVQAIEAASEAGARAVGFVFHEASPRHLSLEAAAALQAAVPSGVERVAVFLHPSQALVDAVIERLRPDWIQADRGDLLGLRLPARQQLLPVLRSGAPWPPSPPARVLFESARSGMGEAADWEAAAGYARETELVLAGGLSAANVGEALHRVRPFGVDVSSGVESRRGVKDLGLITEFIQTAQQANVQAAREKSGR